MLDSLITELSSVALSLVSFYCDSHKGVYHEYTGRFDEFCEVVLQNKLTSQQIIVAESVIKNRITNVPAGHGLGKTNLSACLVLYWIYVLNGVAVTTAPTDRQVKMVLWAEINRLHAAAKLPGVCNIKSLNLSAHARGFGFTGSANNNSSIQGIHYDILLAIQDEANGIHPAVDIAFKSLCTGEENRLLRIGNPTAPYTSFHAACNTEGRIVLNGLEHDNVKDLYHKPEGCRYAILKPEIVEAILDEKGDVKPINLWPDWVPRPRIPGAISVSFIEDIRKLGENSAAWKGRIVGEFPLSATHALFFDELVDASIHPHFEPDPATKYTLGVDVGAGVDCHAISWWKGNYCLGVIEIQTQGDFRDGKRLLAWIKKNFEKEKVGLIYLDADGVGQNLVQPFREAGYNTKGVKWASKPMNPHHANLKAEHYSNLANAFTNLSEDKANSTESAVFFRDIPVELKEELLAVEFVEDQRSGKLQIIPKKDLRVKLGRSTNLADAVALGFAAGRGGLNWLSELARKPTPKGESKQAMLLAAMSRL